MRFLEKRANCVGNDGPNIRHLSQTLFLSSHQGFQPAEMLGQRQRRGLAHFANPQRVQKPRQRRALDYHALDAGCKPGRRAAS